MDELQREAMGWIEMVLGEKFGDESFHSAFKDGVRLCRLLSKVSEVKVQYSESKQAFVQMENISSFVKGLRAIGLNEYELFRACDLFDGKNLKQVVIAIYALNRQLQKQGEFRGPFIWPCIRKQSEYSVHPHVESSSQ